MTDAAGTSVAQLLDAFAAAPPDRVEAAYLDLVGALWNDGKPTEAALPAVPGLIAALATVDTGRQGHLALLLGLLAETEHPATDGELATAVGAGLEGYLALLAAGADGEPRTLALLYLVGHFRADRDRVLAAVDALGVGTDDRSRLDRVLQPLDPDDAVLGRVWPSPAEWTLTEAERAFDQTWVRALAPAQLEATWNTDTRMLLGYSGAKAYWALRHGTPTVVSDVDAPAGAVPASPGEVDVDVFGRFGAVLRCPACRATLGFDAAGVSCTGCGAAYSTRHGVLDLTGAAAVSTEDDPDDVLRNAAAMHSIGLYYESVLRPAFLRLMGSNWGGQVSPGDEDGYLIEHATPTDGPVLDLAAGAGRWTAVLAGRFDPDRLIALDLNPTMLTWLRGRLPALTAVRASALDLPLADASLGGVNCWNALQAMPDPAAAIAEVGRTLAPGGTFTLLTFRWGDDQIYRYFQASFSGPGFPNGMPLFELDQIRGWLADAGLTIDAEHTPGTFVFVTARRTESHRNGSSR